jgi:ABC-type oligopeptide transport system ATPase subunit
MNPNPANSPSTPEPVSQIASIDGKTTPFGFSIRLNTPVARTAYLACHHEDRDFLLGVQRVWSTDKGSFAQVRVIGDPSMTPFSMDTKITMASEEQIKMALKMNFPQENQLGLGKILHSKIDANFNLEKLGRVFITGKSGSGKSYTVGVLIEELIKKRVPVCIIDRHGEYSSLKVLKQENLPENDPFFCPPTEDHSHAEGIIEFGNKEFNPGVDLDVDSLLACEPSDLIATGQCTIINLRGMDIPTQENVAETILKKLYNASTYRKIPSFYLFIDEAHLFAGKKVTPIVEVIRLIAQEGRKFGANVVIITQKPQALDTTIRAQAGTWIIHKLTDVNDVRITFNSAEGLSSDDEDEIQMLAPGEAIITGELSPLTPMRIKVRHRYTVHGGAGYNIMDELQASTQIKPSEIVQRLKARLQSEAPAIQPSENQANTIESPDPAQLKILEQKIEDLQSKIQQLEAENEILTVELDAQKSEINSNSSHGSADLDKLKQIIAENEQLNIKMQETIDENHTLHLELSGIQVELATIKDKYEKEVKRADDALKVAEKLLVELKKAKGR